jgi:hypothetical protein
MNCWLDRKVLSIIEEMMEKHSIESIHFWSRNISALQQPNLWVSWLTPESDASCSGEVIDNTPLHFGCLYSLPPWYAIAHTVYSSPKRCSLGFSRPNARAKILPRIFLQLNFVSRYIESLSYYNQLSPVLKTTTSDYLWNPIKCP